MGIHVGYMIFGRRKSSRVTAGNSAFHGITSSET